MISGDATNVKIKMGDIDGQRSKRANTIIVMVIVMIMRSQHNHRAIQRLKSNSRVERERAVSRLATASAVLVHSVAVNDRSAANLWRPKRQNDCERRTR
jgi:hypothetical protein